jgi:hypothetical protein
MGAYGDYDAYDENGNLEPDDKALEAARMEAQVFGRQGGIGGGGGPNGEGETPRATLRRLFEENSATAAMRIITLSNSAASERVRLDASKYIVERVLGPMTTGAAAGNGSDAEPGSLEHTLHALEQNITGTSTEQ